MAELHSSIIALVSLASGISSNHPAMGQCQLARLRKLGVSEEHIAMVIEIARHIRDEASQKLDQSFDQASYHDEQQTNTQMVEASSQESCCSSTASGQSCC